MNRRELITLVSGAKVSRIHNTLKNSDTMPPPRITKSAHAFSEHYICAIRPCGHHQRKQDRNNSELRHRPPQRISDTSIPSHTAPTAKQNIRTNTTTSEPGVQ
jgi:hypothetical protein